MKANRALTATELKALRQAIDSTEESAVPARYTIGGVPNCVLGHLGAISPQTRVGMPLALKVDLESLFECNRGGKWLMSWQLPPHRKSYPIADFKKEAHALVDRWQAEAV